MLRAGFIGLGRMGLTHLSILNTHSSVEIVAVCDQSSIILNIFKKFFSNVATFSDYKNMIEESELDFVVISTPSNSHAEIVKFAITNNLHTFVGAPLGKGKAHPACPSGDYGNLVSKFLHCLLLTFPLIPAFTLREKGLTSSPPGRGLS